MSLALIAFDWLWSWMPEPYSLTWFAYVGGAVVVLFLGLLLAVHQFMRPKDEIEPFKTEGGRVTIAQATLRGQFQHALATVPGVNKVSTTHRQRGKKLQVNVTIHLVATARLQLVETEIKRRIKALMHSQFSYPEELVTPINVKVAKIVGEPMSMPHTYAVPPPQERPSERPAPNRQIERFEDEPEDERPYVEDADIDERDEREEERPKA